MPRPRVSVAGLAGVLVVVAVGLAAVRNATPAWAGLVTSIAFFCLLASALGVAYRQGHRRAYWVGFALLGWGHMLLAQAPWLSDRIGRGLLATNALTELFLLRHTEDDRDPATPRIWVERGFYGRGGMGGGFRDMAAFGGAGPIDLQETKA